METYTVEEYIRFIESGRYDKISTFALDIIAKRFRELEKNEFKGPGDEHYDESDDTLYELYLIQPGQTKLSVLRTLKQELNISLLEAKYLIDHTPIKIKDKPSSYWESIKFESLKGKLELCGAEIQLK